MSRKRPQQAAILEGRLRGAIRLAGWTLATSGLAVTFATAIDDHVVAPVSLLGMLASGLMLAVAGLRARSVGGLNRIGVDVAVAGGAIAAATLSEVLHYMVGGLAANGVHLAFAGGIAIAGAVFVTFGWAHRDDYRRSGLSRSLRRVGAVLLVATFLRTLLFVWGAVHGVPGALAMVLVPLGGIFLVEAARRRNSLRVAN